MTIIHHIQPRALILNADQCCLQSPAIPSDRELLGFSWPPAAEVKASSKNPLFFEASSPSATGFDSDSDSGVELDQHHFNKGGLKNSLKKASSSMWTSSSASSRSSSFSNAFQEEEASSADPDSSPLFSSLSSSWKKGGKKFPSKYSSSSSSNFLASPSSLGNNNNNNGGGDDDDQDYQFAATKKQLWTELERKWNTAAAVVAGEIH